MSDVKVFKGEDLKGNMNVRIRQGSMQPKSQAAIQSQVMDMVQLGVLSPQNPDHEGIIIQSMDVGGYEELHFHRNLDKRRANIENYMFLRPDPTASSPWPDVDDDDDHYEHIEEHLKFKKSDAYEQLPIPRKVAFEAHMAKHRAGIAAMVEAQAMMMAPGMAGGGSPPKEPGDASQPRERQPTPGSEEN